MLENHGQIEGRLRQECDFSTIIGHTPDIVRILGLIQKVSDIDIPVLIEGESGVGKDLVARAIHYNSKRKNHLSASIAERFQIIYLNLSFLDTRKELLPEPSLKK